MIWKSNRLTIPSNAEYSIAQLRMMLREVESLTGLVMDLERWDAVG